MNRLFLILLLLCANAPMTYSFSGITTNNSLFQTNYFIDNIGQFSTTLPIDFAYYNGTERIYLSKGSIIFKSSTDNKSLEWINSNQEPSIRTYDASSHYFTFGDSKHKAKGWSKVWYKNLYNGVDICYEGSDENTIKYTLHLENSHKLSQIRFQYKGVKDLKLNAAHTEISATMPDKKITEYGLKAFYEDGKEIDLRYKLLPDNIIQFISLSPLDPIKKIIIDPYVSITTTLSGTTATIANMGYDVDYDAQGNLFVLGGGGGINSLNNAPKIAKYDINGNLIWTFFGVLNSPTWNSSPESLSGQVVGCIGNLVVDKISGKVYFGQGYAASGSRVIRLNNSGLYDGFISTANNQFQEIWDLKFNCSNGRVIALGGSINSNLNFEVIDTTSGIVSTSCITGVNGYSQDVVCATLDENGQVYLLFSSNASPTVNNRLYKLSANYGTMLWNSSTGFNTFVEDNNKAYAGQPNFSNGFNALAVNQSYVFYYDGENLKAFDKANGNSIGAPLTIPGHTSKMQGGIFANECNEVFIGGNNGNIYRCDFNGIAFNIQDTLILSGQQGKSTFDITSNPVNNLLYVSGDKFVSIHEQESTCPLSSSGNLILNYSVACPDSAYVTITNADPTVSYTYYWTDSTTNTPIQTIITTPGTTKVGISGLVTGHTYKVTVLKPSPCQIISNTISFIFSCGVTNINLCPGQTYTLNNNTIISTPGLYMDTILNSIGQDSIIYINLQNYLNYHDTTHASICDSNSYMLPSGVSVKYAGIYLSNLKSQYGCDSLITTILSQNTSSSFHENINICNDTTYILANNQIVSTSGTYKVTIPNHLGCDSTITTQLTTTTKPTNFLGKDTTLCNNEQLQINTTILGASYLWNDNSILPKRIISERGTYILSITLPPCSASSDTQVVYACACNVLLPNAFTPNGDGLNEIFKPILNCITPPENYSMYIFNRWGNMIFYTKLQDDGWDGTYLGAKEDSGTYFYFVKYKDPNTGKESNYRGDLLLLR